MPEDDYMNFATIGENKSLDFDDSYQFSLATRFNLTLVTMDKDFKRVKTEMKVIFL